MPEEMSNQTLHEYCSALRTELDLISDANATLMLLSNRTKDLWKSPRGTVIRIEVLVVVVVFMQLFLVAYGSRRRRSRNFFIQKGVLAAYTLSPSLVSYTLGSMQSSAIKSGMYSMWAISLYILFGCADSITAYSLTDNSQLMRQLFQSLLGYLYVFMIMGTTLNMGQVECQANFSGIHGRGCHLIFRTLPLIYLVLVAATYFMQRLAACRMASQSWFLNKMVADYMYQEHTMRGEDYDPATMTGYHYLVECNPGSTYIGDGKYVTRVPSDSIDLDKPKTRDLVFKGLLAKKKEEKENDDGGASAAIDYDWIFKVMYYWTTIWGRVSFACQRIRRKGCCMRLKEILVTIGLWVSPCRWSVHEQKLEQYSLLESVSNFSSQSKLTKFMVKPWNVFLKGLFSNPFELNPFTERMVRRPAVPRHVWSVVWKPGEPAELLAEVKKALVLSLERTHRHGNKLTNGALSLSSSGAYELLWACSLELRQGLELGSVSLQQKENQVCVILTWHIATCYCDKELSASGTNEHYEVATRLSKYCAYLVAFAPKLLPGHHYDTWLAFTVVAQEALRDAGDEETIYRKGLKLGKQLKNVHADRCWEVLAGFWAEMLLYLAPSDNVKEHVECLAKGGEFITHLWALLTHAGILDRGQSDVADIENNGGNQPASRPTNRDGPSTGKSSADCGRSSQ
ncbi:hypothetical protein SETIT_2G010700v2 [Setaria italica]|uniref:DUF4220 domain-containing protein n=1 Tax=Setaria italica TaxID=4555 RepID=A0A368PU97_SETIT|nr:hypothetical protein SETIT_2G010700v2 [Setaria italica]RCV09232.1 hypothetical protein SETIT_2G010700v2 [Setaria italica]